MQLQPHNAKAAHRRGLAAEALKEQQLRQSQGEALKQSLFCKMAGNKLLSDKQFEAAILKYTEGLEWLEDESGAASQGSLKGLLKVIRGEFCGGTQAYEVRQALRANRCQARLKRRQWHPGAIGR